MYQLGFLEQYAIVLVGLRLTAEILGIIANATKNKWDNKIVKVLSEIILLLGKAAGTAGFGKPKYTTPKKP